MPSILVINAGSSSIKYAVYDASTLNRVTRDTVEIPPGQTYDAAFAQILSLIKTHDVVGVGHRVVHGGRDFSAPQNLDAAVLKKLEDLIPLAPLHQPHNLKPAALVMANYPGMPQVACFDTAFHRTQSRLAQIFALPRNLTDDGIVRYGFHGLSYEYIAGVLPKNAGRTIVAHLGNGSSLCAMKDGKSVATTMGFTPLDGLMMGTRTGAIDPGVALYLIEQKGMTAAQVADIFNKHSGLKGVSGTTADMRTLLSAGTPEAAEAVDLYCLTVAKNIASLTVNLGGIDTLVFTAGIGENAAPIREKICAHLGHMNVHINPAANVQKNPGAIGVASGIAVRVIKTDEELMIAQHVRAMLNPAPAPRAPQP
jgi:acetate kinase